MVGEQVLKTEDSNKKSCGKVHQWSNKLRFWLDSENPLWLSKYLYRGLGGKDVYAFWSWFQPALGDIIMKPLKVTVEV